MHLVFYFLAAGVKVFRMPSLTCSICDVLHSNFAFKKTVREKKKKILGAVSKIDECIKKLI